MAKKGLMVYPYLPHYREAVFSELDGLPEYEFVYVTSNEGIRGIRTIPLEKLKNVVPVDNRYFRQFLWQSGVFSTFWRERPDFIIFLADPHYVSSTLLAAAAKLLGVPVFFWTHGWTRPTTRIRSFVKRTYFSLSDSLLLYGNVARTFAAQSGFPDSRLHVIYNSVERPSLSSDSKRSTRLSAEVEKFASGHSHLLGAVARLQDNKSLHEIIEAASYVRLNYPEYDSIGVVLIGDGPIRSRLASLANALNVPLLLPGASYEPSEIEVFYEHVDITVMPDKVGLTGIQSMSHGVPVISNGDPGGQMPEWEAIIPGRTGEHFEKSDPKALGDAVVRLLNGPNLEDFCKAEFERRWSPESQANEIRRFLDGFFDRVTPSNS